jgi:redox-sensing transcriptional repressor
MDSRKIPKPTIKRLAIFHRCLENLVISGVSSISSKDFADRLGIKASQVRKDLSYFGEFGKRGVGYNTELLLDSISEILGIRKRWNTCIVGMGNLGMALANYPGLSKSGFVAKALFDNNPNKIGMPMPNNLAIESTAKLKEIVKSRNIEIGVITVPASAAQSTADLLTEAGIKGIVNFAPIRLSLPQEIINEEIDISASFRSLAFSMTYGSSKKGRKH